MYPLPGPKRPVRIRYVVMSILILELSAVLCTVQASVLFRPFQIRGHIAHTTPFEASIIFQAKRSSLSYCQQLLNNGSFTEELNFYIYSKRNILFECIPINFDFTFYFLSFYFDFTVHSQLKYLCPKSHKIVYFLLKRFTRKKSTQGNRIGEAPFLQGET